MNRRDPTHAWPDATADQLRDRFVNLDIDANYAAGFMSSVLARIATGGAASPKDAARTALERLTVNAPEHPRST